jgi:hypothetical protein
MGCANAAAPRFESATELPDEPRRPDGIAVDLTSEPPAARDEGNSREPYVTLRAPLSVEAAHDTMRAFFHALVREDAAALIEITTPTALSGEMGAKSSNRSDNLVGTWRQRFRKLDYQLLPLTGVYRAVDVRTYRGDQQELLPAVIQSSGAPSAMISRDDEERRDTDIILHVPISTHSVKSVRLLPNEMLFWLRREGDHYVIYRVLEDTVP